MSVPPEGWPDVPGLATRMAAVGNGADDGPRAGSRARTPPRPPRRLSGNEILRLCLVAGLIVLIGAALGYAGTFLLQEQYAARAEVLYSLREDQPTGFLREDRNLTTQLVVIEGRTVLGPVADASGVTYQELAQDVTASVAEGSEVIQIEVRDPDPATGRRLVEAVTQRYLVVANGSVDASRDYLERQLDAVQERLLDPFADATQRAGLTQRRADILDRLDALALAGPQARKLGASYATDQPVAPRRAVAAVAGGAAALLIAALAVILLARRWRRR